MLLGDEGWRGVRQIIGTHRLRRSISDRFRDCGLIFINV